jgi:hypothetical protein
MGEFVFILMAACWGLCLLVVVAAAGAGTKQQQQQQQLLQYLWPAVTALVQERTQELHALE